MIPEPRGVPAASGLCPPLLGWLPTGPPSAAMSSTLRRAGEAWREGAESKGASGGKLVGGACL